jgi:hypothetical protein
MHPFYTFIHAVLEKEKSTVPIPEEPVISYNAFPAILSTETETVSPQIRRWREVMNKIRGYTFSKQVAFIVVFYYTTTLAENNSDLL